MVSEPSAYKWSSYQCNALGRKSSLLTPHELYLNLGCTPSEIQSSYQALFKHHVSEQLITDLRRCTNAGVAFAGERFIHEIESLSNERVSRLKMGRPANKKSLL